MPIRFGRDLAVDPAFSKYDYLAISCARRMRGIVFGTCDSADLSVVQCGDGRAIGPDGFRSGRYGVICHDVDDKYAEVLANAAFVISIGCSIPGSVAFPSYPLDECDMHRLPMQCKDLTVYTGLGEIDTANARVDGGKAVTFNGMPGTAPWCKSRELLSFYIRVAGHVVHSGSGNGTGYIGAMARYHHGTDAIFTNGAGPSSVANMKDFLKHFGSVAK